MRAVGEWSAAVGSPQAVMTEEDLAMKEAAKAGGSLDAAALRKQTKNSRRNGTLRSRHAKKVPSHRELQTRNSNRQIVVPKEARGMVLPFEPLSISFDSISYYVDMPAVSTPPQNTIATLQTSLESNH